MAGHDIRTAAVHAGAKQRKSETAPEVAPIFASSVFRFESMDQVEDVWTGRKEGYVYSRMANPGVEALEEAVDALEGAKGTVAAASGMAAMSLMLQGALKPGARVVAASVLYGSSMTLLKELESAGQLQVRFVDITDPKEVADALEGGADMLFCESISNPLMQVADIPGISALAHRAGALLAVDNTFATPALLKPFELGADIITHSCTKYMNGHDDVTAGTVSVSPKAHGAADILSSIRSARALHGPALSPFEAWLLLRGIRTLAIRMERCSSNALALAHALSSSTRVRFVYYPGLPDRAGVRSASTILKRGYGGMLSFELEGGREQASRLVGALQMAAFVPSLGSCATTVSHPASTSHRGYPSHERAKLGISDGLIRVSVGIEDEKDIVRDFQGALSQMGKAGAGE